MSKAVDIFTGDRADHPLSENKEPIIIPFLKWAGGKRWLAPYLRTAVPEKYGTYFEPFLGGAAVFFHLQPNRAILSDVNKDLIASYQSIRENWQLVRRYLAEFAKQHDEGHYYRERDQLSRSKFRNAARFIYLNRVCWNGLYRVNLRGKFNVPLGTKTSVLLDSDNFPAISDALKGATLHAHDFEKTIDQAGRGDFVFVDPPYITAHNFNGFIKYNEKLFSWEDQVRLKDAVQKAKRRGAMILVANADHASIWNLYEGVGKCMPVSRASVIAGSSQHRQKTTELLIQTY